MSILQYPFFISQNDQDYYPDVTCGPASLMMLLKASNRLPLSSFKELCNQLNLTQPAVKKGYNLDSCLIGTFPEDLIKYIVKANIPFRIHFLEDEWEESLKINPIMVLMIGNENEFGLDGHWIVLVEKKKDVFTYLNPWYQSKDHFVRYITTSDFKHYYTGIALQILE